MRAHLRPLPLAGAVLLATVAVSSWPHAADDDAPNPLAPIAGAQNLHMPFESEECSTCHEGDGPEPGAVQDGARQDVCFLCHTDVEETRDAAKFKHDESGTCVDCHNPHGSNFPSLLLHTPRELCTSCHTDVADTMREAKSDHGPMKSEHACTACHATHGSEHAGLLIAGDKQLCMLCHLQPQRADDGRMLPAMMPLLANAKVVHKPVEQKCAACHSAHGSPQQKLLRAPFPDGFYAPFSPDAYGLCFQCHDAKLVTEATTTTATGFRDGDKNLHTVHVDRGSRGRSCAACHGAHTGPNEVLVHDDVAYGSHGWRLELNFEKTAEGGNCTKTCHLVRRYARTR